MIQFHMLAPMSMWNYVTSARGKAYFLILSCGSSWVSEDSLLKPQDGRHKNLQTLHSSPGTVIRSEEMLRPGRPPLTPALASCEGSYHTQQFLDKRGILKPFFFFFFWFLGSTLSSQVCCLKFTHLTLKTHFQPCIMCSNTALLVYLPHKCCCYCLDVTSSDELAGARNSLLVLALCITSGMRWPPGNWFLVSPCSGNFIRGVSALFDKNRMNFKENASRSSSEQRRDVKANDAEA